MTKNARLRKSNLLLLQAYESVIFNLIKVKKEPKIKWKRSEQ